jgi:hypothetical protein
MASDGLAPPDSLQTPADSTSARIQDALARRWRSPRDPEQRKILAKIWQAISWLQEIDDRGGLTPAVRRSALRLLAEDPTTMSLDGVIAAMDAWDRLLIDTGDEAYLASLLRMELVRDRGASTSVLTWSAVFSTKDRDGWLERLATDGAFAAGRALAQEQLRELYRARTSDYEIGRSRDAMANRVLWVGTLVLASVVALLLIGVARGDAVWTSFAAGALGGALSGAGNIETATRRISALRALIPVTFLQPVIGAAVGVIVLALITAAGPKVLNTALFDTTDLWALGGFLAFAAGYSEPKFIGVVEHLFDAVLDPVSKADPAAEAPAPASAPAGASGSPAIVPPPAEANPPVPTTDPAAESSSAG